LRKDSQNVVLFVFGSSCCCCCCSSSFWKHFEEKGKRQSTKSLKGEFWINTDRIVFEDETVEIHHFVSFENVKVEEVYEGEKLKMLLKIFPLFCFLPSKS
jgi:hypothetical protein